MVVVYMQAVIRHRFADGTDAMLHLDEMVVLTAGHPIVLEQRPSPTLAFCGTCDLAGIVRQELSPTIFTGLGELPALPSGFPPSFLEAAPIDVGTFLIAVAGPCPPSPYASCFKRLLTGIAFAREGPIWAAGTGVPRHPASLTCKV